MESLEIYMIIVHNYYILYHLYLYLYHYHVLEIYLDLYEWSMIIFTIKSPIYTFIEIIMSCP